MGRKSLFFIIPVLFITMACSLTGILPIPSTEPPAPPPGGVTPGAGITPEGGITPGVTLIAPPTVPLFQAVYGKSGNLWRWVEESAPAQITATGMDSLPQLKPDGTQVTYLHGKELWVADVDGSAAHVIVTQAFLDSLIEPDTLAIGIQWFQWDPLYPGIFFSTYAETYAYTLQRFDLWGVETSGSTPPVLIEAPGNGGPITFSPDGNLYAISLADRIVLKVRSGGTHSTPLTFPNVMTYSEWTYLLDVVWLPDSSSFRVVIPPEDPLYYTTALTYFYDVPVSGTRTELASFIASPAFFSRPRISPDGQIVAYMRDNGSNTDLYLNGLTIGNVLYTSYTANQWDVVGWAPDSSHFVYWMNDTRSLWLAAIGSPAVPLTDTTHAADVQWVDFFRLFFLSGTDLRLGTAGGASTLIDTGVDGGYDFYANLLP
jgi:WD40-like Beta Propeller Repeat